MDNASNNDKALSCHQVVLRELEIPFDATESRLRCCGHVIHLVVISFLYGSDIEGDEDLVDLNAGHSQQEMRQWKRRGPYGRLRNIMTYIGWTPQR